MMKDVTELIRSLKILLLEESRLERVLSCNGWIRTQDGLCRLWSQNGLTVKQYGRGDSAWIEANIQVLDAVECEEEAASAVFEEYFTMAAATISSILGESRFVGEYGDQGFPDDLDAIMRADWGGAHFVLALNFKHEDAGLPFRITVSVEPLEGVYR